MLTRSLSFMMRVERIGHLKTCITDIYVHKLMRAWPTVFTLDSASAASAGRRSSGGGAEQHCRYEKGAASTSGRRSERPCQSSSCGYGFVDSSCARAHLVHW